MCATGSPCGCAGGPGGSGTAAVLAAALVITGCVVAFVGAHLVLLAAGAVAVAAGSLGAVLRLRRFMVPEGRARLADPACRRPSRAAVTARPVRALPARQRRAIEAPHRVLTGRVIPAGEREPRGGGR
jgi:hypothetical protein